MLILFILYLAAESVLGMDSMDSGTRMGNKKRAKNAFRLFSFQNCSLKTAAKNGEGGGKRRRKPVLSCASPPLPSPLGSNPYVGSKIIIAKHPSHRAALLPIKLTDVATSLQITDHYVSLKYIEMS